MNFPIGQDKLSGIIRRYADHKFPRIELLPSSTEDPMYGVNNILLYDDNDAHWASARSEGLQASLVVKICNATFYITHYSIRSHHSDRNYIRKWTFEGSDDNINYVMLDDRPINTDLINSGIGQYEVNPERKGFRYFRVMQRVATIEQEVNMRISGFDLYGTYGIDITKKVKMINSFSNSLFVYILIVMSETEETKQ